MAAPSSTAPLLYKTLDSLSFTPTIPDSDTDTAEPYAVFRNHFTSSPGPAAELPTADYFSLDVSADVDAGEKTHLLPLSSSSRENKPKKPKETASESAWFREGSRFKSPMIQLHKGSTVCACLSRAGSDLIFWSKLLSMLSTAERDAEILDFCDFVSPTPEEQASRTAAIHGVSEVIKYIWPHCNVEVFGSFRTGLYLPTSDVDVVILDSNVNTPQMGIRALHRAFSQRSIAKQIQPILKARVPIIKFVEKQSGLSFDISFDMDGGPKAAVFIKDAVRKLPPLRPLCLILKVFLQQRQLNEVYSGGIGSYTLLAMLIAHLQMHWRGQNLQHRQQSMEHNLGILLVNFFDFYGRKLNASDVGVSCNSASIFFRKVDKGFFNSERPYLLSVEDPQAPDNDIGRNSFNFFQVKSAFSMAYSLLTDAKAIHRLGPHKSILGTIIRPDSVLLDRKGGAKGELTFDSLLPGAGEPVPRQIEDGSDVLYNWQLVDDDDDEPLPREKLFAEEDDESSQKRKSKKARHRLKRCDATEPSKSKHKANGVSSSEPAAKKKKRKIFRDDDDGHGRSLFHWKLSR